MADTSDRDEVVRLTKNRLPRIAGLDLQRRSPTSLQAIRSVDLCGKAGSCQAPLAMSGSSVHLFCAITSFQ